MQQPLPDPIQLTDRYELRQSLGRKVGRRTFLAWDQQQQEQVVIKLLLFGQDFEWEALKLFEREAQTLQNLEHEAIPKYLDWFDTTLEGAAGFALVQTYIPAPCLETIMRSGRTFSAQELTDIAEQILDILEYLHGRHPAVIHRDLKPSNILLGERSGHSPGKISLVDFGSVQTLLNARGETITIVGTYGYMPMEQFGDRAVPASDLYSLGATMLYLATGQDPADFLEDDFQVQIKDYPGLTPTLHDWIEQLMQPKVKDRVNSTQTARQLLHQPKQLSALALPKPSSKKSNILQSQLKCRRGQPSISKFEVIRQESDYLEICCSSRHISIRKNSSHDNTLAQKMIFYSALLILLLSLFFALVHYLMIGNFWVYLLAGIYLISCLVRYIEQINNTITFSITPTSIKIRSSNGLKKDQNIPRYEAWKIEYDDYRLRLMIGSQTLIFSGGQMDILWLAGEFSHHLQLPAVRKMPPESAQSPI